MPKPTIQLLKMLFILLIPILILATSVHVLATDQYLAFEYGKATFPRDPFGFTDRQRFILASTNVHYVRAHLPNNELAKQTLDGIPVYNPREVSHMADVRTVFKVVLFTEKIALLLLLLIALSVWQKGEPRMLGSAIQWGGLLTSAFILTTGLLVIFSWQSWFNIFHLFFFEPGSWLFSYSDTLIRLFPVKFWFDATLTISALGLIGGLITALVGWKWQMALNRDTEVIPL
jgi:integral membrane protein (TIGR01906 family)